MDTPPEGHEPEKAPGTANTSRDSSPPRRSITGVRWALVIAGIVSSTFLFALDNTIVADVQPKIIDTFGEIDKLPWLSVAFALGNAASVLVWSAIYTIFDAKWTYVTSIVLFEIGSAICGAANMMNVEIFGRALGGIGGIGMYVGALTLVSVLTTPAERGVYLASTNMIWGVGSVLGPLIGGAFGDSSATWRWSFYINLVVAGLFAPVYIFLLPSLDPAPTKSVKEKWVGVDFLGAFLFIGMMGFSITGISFGGSVFDWNSATIIVLLVLGAVFFALFSVQQAFAFGTSYERRLLPAQYFKNRTLFLIFFLTGLIPSGIYIPTYFVPLFFQFTRGDGALQAAVRLLPFLFMMVFFTLAIATVIGKEGHYAPWYYFSALLVIAAAALMFTVDENTSDARIYGYTALLGMGSGAVTQTGYAVAQAINPPAELASSVAFVNVGQIGGLALSLTIANTIFLNLAQVYLRQVLPMADSETIKSAISGTGGTFISSLSPELRAQAIHAVTMAISRSYIFVLAAACLQVVLCFGLKWERVFVTG